MDKDKIFDGIEKVNSGWNKFRTWATFIRVILLFFVGIAFVITGLAVNSELAVYIEKTTVVITDKPNSALPAYFDALFIEPLTPPL